MSDQATQGKTVYVAAITPALLDYEGAAAYLSLERRYLEQLVHDGRIPYMRIGRLVRFPVAGLEMWIEEQSRYETKLVSESLLVRRRRREAGLEGNGGRPREALRGMIDGRG